MGIVEIIGLVLGGGGIGSFITWLIHLKAEKRIKNAEAKSAEISTVSAANEEWIKLAQLHANERLELIAEIHKLLDAINILKDEIDELNKEKAEAWEAFHEEEKKTSKLEKHVVELEWYRCEINRCPYRKPPRKFGSMDFPEGAVVDTTHETE